MTEYRLSDEDCGAIVRASIDPGRVLGGPGVDPLLVEVERIVARERAAARAEVEAAVLALADEWEQTPNHIKCYGLDRAHGSRLRDALGDA